jgi:hypothetical protein
VDEELADQLSGKAQAEGVELLGALESATLCKHHPSLPVTLCYRKAGRAVARIVARESEHTVRQVHSGTQVLLSAQVACPGRCAGLLVMRRSGVRFPKAAQVEVQIS